MRTKSVTAFYYPAFLCLLSMMLSFSIAAKEIHLDRIKFQEEKLNLPGAFGSGVVQDKEGFFWFGLQSGLAKWDGRRLFVYDTQNSQLTHIHITGLLEDKDGYLWVATRGGGLNRYDKRSNTFTSFRHDKNNPKSIASDSLGSVYTEQTLVQDQQGYIWVVSNNAGVSRLDPKNGEFTRFQHVPTLASSLSSNKATSVMCDRLGNIWIGTQDGLNRFRVEDHHFEHFPTKSSSKEGLSHSYILSLLEDSDGAIWVGTKNGLNQMDRQGKRFTSYRPSAVSGKGPSLPSITAIAEDRRGNLWLAYAENKLDIFDRKAQRFIQHTAEDYDPDRLHGGKIDNVFVDRQGVVWIFSYDGRLNKYNENAYKFDLYRTEINNPRSIPINSVQTIYQDKQNTIWFDGNLHGIFNYAKETEDFNRFPMPGSSHRPFLEDSNGTLWMGGISKDQTSSALYVLDKRTMLPIKEFVLPRGSMTADMIEDPVDQNILWFTTNEQGLGRFDKESGKFDFFSHDPQDSKSISSNSLWDLAFDLQDPRILWIGSIDGGLVKLDTETAQFTSYMHDPMNPDSISSNAVYSFKQTSRGEFWVMAKGGGLEKFDKKTGRFEHYNQRNGRFPMDKAVNILEDKNGILWLNAPGGYIVKFNPIDGSHHLFSREDGVQGGAAWAGGNLVDASHRLWFTGGLGINAFYPEEVKESDFNPPIYFTAITQGGKALTTSAATEFVNQIEIDWKSNFFEFEVIALDYAHPDQNEYQYKLEGWDQTWYNAGTKNYGRYSSLAGGQYTLRVRGTNSDRVWSSKEAQLLVIVTPPFWQTWWFYSLLILLGVSAILIIFRQRTNAIRLHNEELKIRSDELERRVTERTQELKKVMDKLLQSEKLAALGHLVAGVAHELNTPLGNARLVGTSMHEWVQELSDDIQADKVKRSNLLRFVQLSHDGMQVLERNLVRAGNLVAGFKEIAVLQNDEKPQSFVLHDRLLKLTQTIPLEGRAIQIEFDLDIPKDLILHSFPEALDQVFRKLISNSLTHGFKESEQGKISINVEYQEGDRQLQIVYADNGVGIASSIRHRVFEPFFTTQLGQGDSGLGLYIVYNLISAVLDGQIELLDDGSQSAIFKIILPVDVTQEV